MGCSSVTLLPHSQALTLDCMGQSATQTHFSCVLVQRQTLKTLLKSFQKYPTSKRQQVEWERTQLGELRSPCPHRAWYCHGSIASYKSCPSSSAQPCRLQCRHKPKLLSQTPRLIPLCCTLVSIGKVLSLPSYFNCIHSAAGSKMSKLMKSVDKPFKSLKWLGYIYWCEREKKKKRVNEKKK